MINKVFYFDILDDLPVLIAVFMSIYPEYQNKTVFFLSLIIGIISSVILAKAVRSISMEDFVSSFSTFEIMSYFIYTFFLLGFVVYLTLKGNLYMGLLVWIYIVVTFFINLFSLKKSTE